MSSPGAGYGQANPSDGNTEFNRLAFQIRQAMALLSAAQLVKVTAVTAAGEVAAPVFVDVQPLVRMVDGQGNTSDHGIIHGLPYFRLQGGQNGIICDPAVGDIGLAVICDRDISSVKETRAVASPGSWRQHSLADGFYLGGWPAVPPEQYVQFNADGMTWHDKFNNTIVSNTDGVFVNGIKFDRSQNISGVDNIDGTGEVTFDGHTLTAHVHGGVASGSADTDPPTG